MNHRWPFLMLALGAAGAAPAWADEGAGPEDPLAKLRAQAERVLRLMRANEDALLKASTAGGQAPKGPDVPIPDLPPAPAAGTPESGQQGSGQQGSGQQGSGQQGSGQQGTGQQGESGQGAKQSIEELMRALQEGGGMIPRELEELMRMVPT